MFLRLGLTSFGGPIAHLGYFRSEFVERRKWINEHAYADLVTLCQFLPGPASSQVGIALGLFQGGLKGAIASWAGFTLPSAIIMVFLGLLFGHFAISGNGWLNGLKIVTVAVVAQTLWVMWKSFCPGKQQATIALSAAVAMTWIPGAVTQIATIAIGALTGWLWFIPLESLPHSPFPLRFGKRTGTASLLLFLILLVLLPAAATESGSQAIKLFDAFFRAGSLVFGGGHTVLPVLQSEVVPTGWVSNDEFLAGYGAAQALPGPLFTFAVYLGAISHKPPDGWIGASIALFAIFLPAFLLVICALPIWEGARRYVKMHSAMLGINAAVVGLLLAAFYNPVWTSAIHSINDFALAAISFLLLVYWKTPPLLVVILCVAIAWLMK